jgi:hypothetical protein
MKMQKVLASFALILFIGGGLLALLNTKDREQNITANLNKLQDECLQQCKPKTGALVEVWQFQNRPPTVRGNRLIERKCVCS